MPPFTRAALLQPEEFLEFGWDEMEQISVRYGVSKDLELFCIPASLIADDAQDAYSATYRGSPADAAEAVARYPDTATADRVLDQAARQVTDCPVGGEAPSSKASTRHEPRLEGVDRAVWWNTETVYADGTRTPGVIGLARVDDRLVVLFLRSWAGDPADTVQVEPLLTQAARRLV